MANASPSNDSTNTVLDCMRLCLQCANECIDHDGKDMANCIKLCQICADTCALCLKCMASGVQVHRPICGACATVCDACAAECSTGATATMQQCADACTRCAVACREMAGA